jgi:DNA-binding winged helix-turn-helix (wHTH) protein
LLLGRCGAYHQHRVSDFQAGSKEREAPLRVRFGEFVLDTDSRQLLRQGAEVHLQPKTFELLALLVGARPKALGKRAIRGQLWADVVVGDASLTVAVAELRAALGDDAKEPRYVRTVYGFGYAFAGEAEEVSPEARPGGTGPATAARVLWEKRVIPLLPGDNVLGRGEDVEVRIDAPGVSRHHARIRNDGGEPTIEDLGSKNGTFVGDEAAPIVGPVPLSDGRRFRLGRVLLVFRVSPEAGETRTERG